MTTFFPLACRAAARRFLLLSLLAVPACVLAYDINNGDVVSVPTTQSSPWTLDEILYVGHSSNGELAISGTGSSVSSWSGSVGHDSGVTGSASVMDEAVWTNTGAGTDTGHLFIGYYGNGTLTISDGGVVSNTEDGTIGFFSGSTGTATVNGNGSQWTNTGNLFVGYSGNGTLAISDEGVVSSVDGVIGSDSGGTGTVTISGTDSQWVNSDNFSVGYFGNGTLVISDGGLVTAPAVHVAFDVDSTGVLSIGAESGATPDVPGVLDARTLDFGDGDGRLVFNHTATDYAFDAEMSSLSAGQGLVQALAGRTIFNADHGDFTGTLQASAAGILQVNGDVSGASADVQAGGTLEGNGTVGDTTNAGTIAPGIPGAPFDTLTVGNYTGSNGMLEIETALGDDSSATDSLAVTGDTGGATRIRVSNQGGTGAATTGNGIRVVQVEGASSGTFTLANAVRAGDYVYTLAQVGNDWYLQSRYSPAAAGTAIPVTGAGGLAALGLGMLLAAGWLMRRQARR